MKKVLSCLSARDEAQVAVLVALLMPVLLTLVGVVLDGGLAFSEWRDWKDVADAAARTGAVQVDQQLYRQSDGATLALDPAAAKAAAAQYVAQQHLPDVTASDVSADTDQVVVRLSGDVQTNFLRAVGITKVHISVVGPAQVRYGIDRSNR